jgi:hypothetical protein
MAPNDVHRLRKRCVRIAEQQHARRSEGTQQQQHVETATQERQRANRQESAETSQQYRANAQMRRALAAGTATALQEIRHFGFGCLRRVTRSA